MSARDQHDFPILLVFALCSQTGIFEDGNIFLERGYRGIVPSPPFISGRITLVEIDAVYWYFRQVEIRSLLISYFRGTVAPQNGIPEGVYDIDSNFSLVIENATDSDEGIYFYRVKPRLKMVVDGHVTVAVKVSAKEQFPIVTECKRHKQKSTCEALLPDNTLKPRLTCVVENAKPAVAVRWLFVYSNGDTEILSDEFTVQHVVFPKNTTNPNWFWMNNTFKTSSSIPLLSCNIFETMYRCEAFGDALGIKNVRHVTVNVTKAPLTNKKRYLTTGTPSTTINADNLQANIDWQQTALILLGISCLSIIINVILVITMKRRKLCMC